MPIIDGKPWVIYVYGGAHFPEEHRLETRMLVLWCTTAVNWQNCIVKRHLGDANTPWHTFNGWNRRLKSREVQPHIHCSDSGCVWIRRLITSSGAQAVRDPDYRVRLADHTNNKLATRSLASCWLQPGSCFFNSQFPKPRASNQVHNRHDSPAYAFGLCVSYLANSVWMEPHPTFCDSKRIHVRLVLQAANSSKFT